MRTTTRLLIDESQDAIVKKLAKLKVNIEQGTLGVAKTRLASTYTVRLQMWGKSLTRSKLDRDDACVTKSRVERCGEIRF